MPVKNSVFDLKDQESKKYLNPPKNRGQNYNKMVIGI